MNISDDEKKLDKFIKQCFKSWCIKYLIIVNVIWISSFYLQGERKNIVVIILITLIPSIIFYFILPNLLYKETRKAINGFYNYKDHNDDMIAICNLKKINGPSLGLLKINSTKIKFVPFKTNLKSETITICKDNKENVRIRLFTLKWDILNRIFFGEIYQAIKITCNNLNITLQTVEPEYVIKKLIEGLER